MAKRFITKENIFSIIPDREEAWKKDYLAMYSTLWNGITTDPDLMLIPIDDHVVHRGDGVFDVMRCVDGNMYHMEAHLHRLENSARVISLDPPEQYSDIRELIRETVLAGGHKDCLVRIMLTRGPGSFSPNPFDCPSSQMYINVIRFKPYPTEYYKQGVCLITSQIPPKKSFFANIKSCDYLPNVLMKMEALKAGCPFSVSIDEEGFITEGPTENIVVVTSDGKMKIPGFDRTLAGITAKRIFELAQILVQRRLIQGVEFAKITRDQAYNAKEIFLTGTSVAVLPVVSYDGHIIDKGVPGPIYQGLYQLLWQDMTDNNELLTPIFDEN